MAIEKRFDRNGATVLIRVTDAFDGRVYTDFKSTFEQDGGVLRYEVDLSAVTSMDSSGLGLLVHLREHAVRTDAAIVLVNPSEVARRNLETAYFHDLFTIVCRPTDSVP